MALTGWYFIIIIYFWRFSLNKQQMPNPYFQFKQFTVWHDRCAMKVGTDGVLLGAWTPVEGAFRILDVGTGTGLVALMLAQRSLESSVIVALEIDEAAAGQAQENVARSPWHDRIEVLQMDFRAYQSTEKFDVIVSNPPYFLDSMECPNEQRSAARHNKSLIYNGLLKKTVSLLSDNGVFAIVIPSDVVGKVKEIAYAYDLYPSHQLDVVTKPGAKPKRTLITFTFKKQECKEKVLLTEVARHQYTDEYIALTKEYYLKL